MTSSIWDVNTLAAFNGVQYRPAGVIFAVDGTGYLGAPGVPPPGAGYSSDIIYGLMNAQDGLWQGVFIPYPAAVFPMGPSVTAGRSTLVSSIQSYAGSYYAANGSYDGMVIVLTGYSQGAMVTGQVWTQDILDDLGQLHYLLPYVWRVYQFGDPYRSPGIAHGNELLGQPVPPQVDGYTTGGIGGPNDLLPAQTNVQAPDGKFVVTSFANPGDLYADCPVGDSPWTNEAFTNLAQDAIDTIMGTAQVPLWEAVAQVGAVEYSIFSVVQQATFVNVVSLAADLLMPVGAVEGIINGLTFAVQGTNAPHWHYEAACQAAVDELLAIGNALPHAGPL